MGPPWGLSCPVPGPFRAAWEIGVSTYIYTVRGYFCPHLAYIRVYTGERSCVGKKTQKVLLCIYVYTLTHVLVHTSIHALRIHAS